MYRSIPSGEAFQLFQNQDVASVAQLEHNCTVTKRYLAGNTQIHFFQVISGK